MREVRIESAPSLMQAFYDLRSHRELFLQLVRRNIMIHYKQSLLGIGWALVRPLAAAGVVAFVVGQLVMKRPTDMSYGIFVLAAVVAFQLFVSTLGSLTESLVANASILTKVYMPRAAVALAHTAHAALDALVGATLSIALSLFVNGARSELLLLPAALILGYLAALGPGLALAIFNAQFRDARHALPFVTQVLYLAAPIAYATSDLPERIRLAAYAFPLVGAIDLARFALVPETSIEPVGVALSFASAVLCCILGSVYFARHEAAIVDGI